MRLTQIIIPSLLLGWGAAAADPPAVATPAPEPRLAATTVVESFHATLIEIMKEAEVIGFEGRYEKAAANLDQAFDLPFMARVSIGRAWRDLGEEERRNWVGLSRRYSASSYAHNFSGHSGQSFETLAFEPAARGTVWVRTELVQPSDDNVKLDYRLRETSEGWRIIDVRLDGKVSEITLRRADYGSVIERQGFDQLVANLHEKIAKMAGER